MYFTLSEGADLKVEPGKPSHPSFQRGSSSLTRTSSRGRTATHTMFSATSGRALGPNNTVKYFPVRGLRSRRSKGSRVKESWDVQICDDGCGGPFFVVKYRDQRRARHDIPPDRYTTSKNGEVMSALHEDLEDIQRGAKKSDVSKARERSVKVELRPGVGLNVALFQRVLCRYGNPESFVSTDLDNFIVTYQSPEQATSALMNFSLDLHHYIERVDLVMDAPPSSTFSLFSEPGTAFKAFLRDDERYLFPLAAEKDEEDELRVTSDLEERLFALVEELCG